MQDKLIERAVECYIEKLRAENIQLKDLIRQINNAFNCVNGKHRDSSEIINDIISILRVYHALFEEGEKS